MNGTPTTLLSGRANRKLAEDCARALRSRLGACRLEDYPDGEIGVTVEEPVQGRQVFLLQPTAPPVGRNVLELLLMADACLRAGARRIIAVVPYFGYARQDRRTDHGQALGGRLLADLLAARLQNLVTVDLHEPAIEGFLPVVENLSAVELLAEALRPVPEASVVVAPDLGAAKRAQELAAVLDLPVAYVHKIRQDGSRVEVQAVSGEVRDREPILVDDMISTGGTLLSAAEALQKQGCRPRFRVASTHGPLVPEEALAKLSRISLEALVITDSIRHPPEVLDRARVISVGPLLAATLKRLEAVDLS